LENVPKRDVTAWEIADDSSDYNHLAMSGVNAEGLHRVSICRLRFLVPSLDGGGATERPAFITHDTVGREAPSEGARITSQVGGEVVGNRFGKSSHKSQDRHDTDRTARTHKKVRFLPKGKQKHTVASAAKGVEDVPRILEGRWNLVILFHLFGGNLRRFSELRRAIPTVSERC
jgi:HxlR-like helix-turn-helix protein